MKLVPTVPWGPQPVAAGPRLQRLGGNKNRGRHFNFAVISLFHAGTAANAACALAAGGTEEVISQIISLLSAAARGWTHRVEIFVIIAT